MKAGVRKRLNSAARHLLARDYVSAEDFLASWLRDGGAGRLGSAVEKQAQATRAMFSDEELGDADSFELDDCPIRVDELREDGVVLPEQISATNYRGWCRISIRSDDGEWSLYDLWCAMVEDEGELVIGYYEVAHPD